MAEEEKKKIQKEKLALTSLSTKIYLKRAGREHTHTHTHTHTRARKEEEEEVKEVKEEEDKKQKEKWRKENPWPIREP